MANQFVNLPAPAGNGDGAAVDVSSFGALKTIVCGGNARAQITVEVNNAVVSTDGSWVAVAGFQNTGAATIRVAARWMRMRVSNYNPYVGGTPQVDIGGTDSGTLFQTLIAPAGDGAGASVNVSALGLYKSVQVGGAFRGTLIVEVSEDGVQWAQPFSFQTPGVQSAVIAADFMRVRRVGVPDVAPGLPIINIGATDDFSGDDGVAISAGSQSAVTGTVVFANSNGVSFGMSLSSQVTASMDAFRSVIGPGSTATGPTLSFANSNGVSFGVSGQTITASAGAAVALAAGTQTGATGTVLFSNSNNVSFGMAGSSLVTATASFPAETPFGLSAGSQSVSTGTLLFSNSNGISFGMSGSSRITASYTQSTAPAAISAAGSSVSSGTVVFSNSNGVSFGMNGNTVTGSVAAQTIQLSGWSPYYQVSSSGADPGNSSLVVQPLDFPTDVLFSQLIMPISFSAANASTGTASVTFNWAIYTRNVSTLSRLHSTSFSMSFPFNSTNSSASFNGFRISSAPWTSTITKGNYWVGVQYQSTTSSQDASISFYVAPNQGIIFSGFVGQGLATSNQVQLGMGVFRSTVTAPPTSMAISDIQGTQIAARRPYVWTLGGTTF